MQVTVTDQVEGVIADFLQDHPSTPDQLLPLLHCIRQACGFVPVDTAARVAEALTISRAEVSGVLSFYEDFTSAGRHERIDICCAEACQACGSRELHEALEQRLRDTGTSLRKVYCLGNCAAAPSVRIGDTVIGRATAEKVGRNPKNP